jgi:hypothetical protein
LVAFASASVQQKLCISELESGSIESAAPPEPSRDESTHRLIRDFVQDSIRSIRCGTPNHAPQGCICSRSSIRHGKMIPSPFALSICPDLHALSKLQKCGLLHGADPACKPEFPHYSPALRNHEDPMACIMQECPPTVPAPSSPEPRRPCWQSQCRLQSFCIMVQPLASGR